MGIGLSGMISGMDTDSIVKALVSAQRTKATKIENKITLNKWTTDAWSALNTKIYSFYTKYASKLRMQGTYMSRKATSSNESIVKATANSSAAVGTHTLQIKKLASSQYVTSGQISKTAEEYNRNTKLVDIGGKGLGVRAGTIITIQGKKGTDSPKEVKLEVDENTTIDDFLKACKEAGLTASFDLKQQRFFISSSASGLDDKFSITTSMLSEAAQKAFQKISAKVDESKLSEKDKTSYESAMATLRQNTDALKEVFRQNLTLENATDKRHRAVLNAMETVKNIAADQEAGNMAADKVRTEDWDIIGARTDGKFTLYGTEYNYDELEKRAEANQEVIYGTKATNAAMDDLQQYMKETGIEKLEDQGAYADPSKITYAVAQSAKKAYGEFDPAKQAFLTTIDQTNKDQLAQAVEDGDLTEEDIKTIEIINTLSYEGSDAASGKTIKVKDVYNAKYTEVSADKTADVEKVIYNTILEDKDNMAQYNEKVAGFKAGYLAEEDGNPTLNQLKAEIENELKKAAAEDYENPLDALKALGLGEINGQEVTEADGNNGMVVIEASNSEFVLDGVTMKETSNNFTVNGLTLDLIATTQKKDAADEYDTVQIVVGKDATATYDFIKEALTEYNKLIEEMNGLYNAKSARGYDPLTSEQKEAMAEADIEAWEGKIKGALLRRDDTLGGLLSGMRTALSSTYTNADGKTFSLSTFGIVTGNYTEYGQLHIYGDEDDSLYAEYKDRLKKALEEDPDEVMDALSHIFGNLYTTMQEKCAAKKDISSALTFYNDKSYNKALEGYEKDLKKMEEKIKNLEDRYYKQFTAMETALAKLQSQTNSLAAMLGTGSGQ